MSLVRRPRPRDKGATGQALVWVAVLAPLFCAVVGLAIDGGIVLAARRDAQNAADAAARAGAMQIDITTYRATAGTWVQLDPAQAGAAARSSLAAEGWGDASVAASVQSVVVTTRRTVPLGFLRLIGIESASVGATARAAPYFGIATGRP